MIEYPAWYGGGWPDQELIACDLLTPFLNLLTPTGLAVTWLPDDYEKRVPIVRAYRTGGGADAEGNLDVGMVQLGVIGASRADSWSVAEFCRQVFLSYEHGGKVLRADSTITNVVSISEAVGPQQLPELNPDYRLVPMTFQMVTSKPRPRPNYALIRESL